MPWYSQNLFKWQNYIIGLLQNLRITLAIRTSVDLDRLKPVEWTERKYPLKCYHTNIIYSLITLFSIIVACHRKTATKLSIPPTLKEQHQPPTLEATPFNQKGRPLQTGSGQHQNQWNLFHDLIGLSPLSWIEKPKSIGKPCIKRNSKSMIQLLYGPSKQWTNDTT